MSDQNKIRLAIFASGDGSNAISLIKKLDNHPTLEVAFVMSNNPDAKALLSAAALGMETLVFNRKQFYESDQLLNFLKEEEIRWIVLAGFLWYVPENMLKAYQNRIINIHPALLPKFGGKGMYGKKVHEAVIDAGEKESGLTIHLVNDQYDGGKIIFQKTCEVDEIDSAESLGQKIKRLEHENYARVIEEYISANENVGALPD